MRLIVLTAVDIILAVSGWILVPLIIWENWDQETSATVVGACAGCLAFSWTCAFDAVKRLEKEDTA